MAIIEIDIRVLPDGRVSRLHAADYIGTAPKTLANYATDGVGPRPYKVGGRIWYYLDDLDAWVRHGARTAGAGNGR